MMVVSKVARRYAAALIGLAIELKQTTAVSADIVMLQTAIRQSRDLASFLKSPVISRERKKSALYALFQERVSVTTMSFIDQLVRKNRESELHAICEAYQTLSDKHAGIERVDVISALKLDDKTLAALKVAVEKMTGKTAMLTASVDAELIAGVKIRIGDTVHDGTARTQLDKLSGVLINSVA